jgi:hypothetical protein
VVQITFQMALEAAFGSSARASWDGWSSKSMALVLSLTSVMFWLFWRKSVILVAKEGAVKFGVFAFQGAGDKDEGIAMEALFSAGLEEIDFGAFGLEVNYVAVDGGILVDAVGLAWIDKNVGKFAIAPDAECSEFVGSHFSEVFLEICHNFFAETGGACKGWVRLMDETEGDKVHDE